MQNTKTPPNCHLCGAVMVLRQTNKFHFRNGAPRVFYGCSNYPDCRGIRPSHPDGTYYGNPAPDEETKDWRRKAHAEFDKLWKQWGYTRPSAYRLLQTIMQLKPEEAHISLFSKEQCQELVKKLEASKQ